MTLDGRRSTFRVVGLLAVVGVFLAGSSVAACIPQPLLITVAPRSSAPSGSEVTVAALGFDTGRAEIRWNSSDGELLGSANGPDFSTTVKIPQVPDGLYNLIVLGRPPAGTIGSTASVAFQVTSAHKASSRPWSVPASAETVEQATDARSAGTVGLSAGIGALVSIAFLGVAGLLRRRRQVVPQALVEPHGG